MSWAAIAVTAIVAGTATSAYGMYQSGRAAEAQGEAEAEIAAYNARIKEREAEAERQRAKSEAQKFEKEGRALLGEQKAKLAKGGVLVSSGTAALLLEGTAKELEQDRLAILREGYQRGGYRESEARIARMQGTSAKARGRASKTAATYQAGGTVLTGIGSAVVAGKTMKK